MGAQTIFSIKSLLIVFTTFSCVEIFAQGVTSKQPLPGRKARTEAGINVHCNCSNGFSQNDKVDLNLKQLKRFFNDPKLEKLGVYSHLEEKFIQEHSQNSGGIGAGTSDLNLQFKKNKPFVSFKIDNPTAGGVSVGLSELVEAAADDLPVVKEIAKNVNVTAGCTGKVTEKGVIACQEKAVGLETKKKDRPINTKIVYTTCDKNKGYLGIGEIGGCSFENSVESKISLIKKNKLGRFSLDAQVLSPNLVFDGSQFGLVFNYKY